MRRTVHVLEAAGDRAIDFAARDLLRGGDDRLAARAADAVYGHGGNADRQAAAERRLPRRVLAIAGLDDIAHHHAAEFFRIEA